MLLLPIFERSVDSTDTGHGLLRLSQESGVRTFEREVSNSHTKKLPLSGPNQNDAVTVESLLTWPRGQSVSRPGTEN